jgi:predicted 3-demethylubiquinone-9 3-methyltransferase (glyoxalase superfamily)
MGNKITPFLWFNNQAEEAMNYYVSIFPDSEALGVTRFGESAPGSDVPVLTANFRLGSQEFVALNGGPMFTFTEAVSFVIDCASQDEVDYYWEKLTDGGEESMCGWLKDKYGLSWQVVPRRLMELLSDPDPGRAGRATEAMMQMHKIDVSVLERAADAS